MFPPLVAVTITPGLVVIREDSCQRGREFESKYQNTISIFFTFVSFKIVLVFEKTGNKKIKKAIFIQKNQPNKSVLGEIPDL